VAQVGRSNLTKGRKRGGVDRGFSVKVAHSFVPEKKRKRAHRLGPEGTHAVRRRRKKHCAIQEKDETGWPTRRQKIGSANAICAVRSEIALKKEKKGRESRRTGEKKKRFFNPKKKKTV